MGWITVSTLTVAIISLSLMFFFIASVRYIRHSRRRVSIRVKNLISTSRIVGVASLAIFLILFYTTEIM